MGVLAHPDDESLGIGGALAKYAAEGVECHLLTATRGERGRYRDGTSHPGPEALGRIREAELRAAAAVLGVRDVRFLDYLDGELDRADAREAIGRIAQALRRVRPDAVITFPPDGGYGHPDHIAICQFATAAIVAAADGSYAPAEATERLASHRVSKLYYFASTPGKWEAYQTAFKKLTSTVDGVLRQASPWPEWEITTRVDTSAHWPTVWKAVQCHESQIVGYAGLATLPAEQHRALWGSQEFYRAMSLVNGGRARETDLFEGLR